MLTLCGCSRDPKADVLRAEITSPSMDIEIKEAETVFFGGTASGGVPPYTYLWDLGVIAKDIPAQYTQEIAFEYEGAYMITFTVTDSTGHQASDTVRIIVTPRDSML